MVLVFFSVQIVWVFVQQSLNFGVYWCPRERCISNSNKFSLIFPFCWQDFSNTQHPGGENCNIDYDQANLRVLHICHKNANFQWWKCCKSHHTVHHTLQWWWMQRHKTQEVAQEGMLFTDSVGVVGGGGCFFYKWFVGIRTSNRSDNRCLQFATFTSSPLVFTHTPLQWWRQVNRQRINKTM